MCIAKGHLLGSNYHNAAHDYSKCEEIRASLSVVMPCKTATMPRVHKLP